MLEGRPTLIFLPPIMTPFICSKASCAASGISYSTNANLARRGTIITMQTLISYGNLDGDDTIIHAWPYHSRPPVPSRDAAPLPAPAQCPGSHAGVVSSHGKC
ncbi:hypothetical protein E2C01_001939 [Portunus trituberculatus]|uniref:Uncharacterized protein n=1 Tax=Portunus trituberculatus TaxID=210409 RepID=A0A5B7CI30_PORTR|nr:hypothetical protein [Portunus trituberculatus]